MADTITSPNMNLPVPVVTVDPGPDWATNVNACLGTIDSHNHSSGQGRPINPSGISINSDLPFNSNNATLLRSTQYTPQASPLSLPSDIGCVYVSGVDLYYNDVNGNQIQITASGTVNATSSGIASGTATASFSAGVLVVDAATSTPANIQAASLVMGNNVANSKYLTLSPPNSMAANYNLVLPAVPSSATSIMQLDTSGNMTASLTVDGSTIVINSNVLEVATGGITTAQLANGSVTRPTQAAVGQQISSSSGGFSGTSGSFANVTNLSVTITTTGRPVFVGIQSDGNGTESVIASVSTTSTTDVNSEFRILRGATEICHYAVANEGASGHLAAVAPTSSIWVLDTPSAGTYTYQVQYLNTNASFTECVNAVLVAYEL